jgi:Lrp/AsnC family transcriptional regulator, leucine-responsive regulatory protein
MPVHLDEIDRHILQELQEDARVSNRELASRVGLSPAPCLRRVRQLEQAGVIRKYVALLDPGALRVGVTVFVQISLDRQAQERVEIFEKAIARRPELVECYLMSGEVDYLLRVVVPDIASYERFLKECLARIESVAGIKSNVAFKQVKYSTSIPLESTRDPEPAPRRTAHKRGQGRHRR